MGKKDPRIDAYIAKSADFARPILVEIRKRIHAACPDVEETLKWSMPHFMYRGKMLGGMSAFKAHAALGFWHPEMRIAGASDAAMGQFGRLTKMGDLPSAAQFARLTKRAMKLVDDGVKAAPKPKVARPEAAVPADLAAALAKNRKAKATFDGFSPSHRREYVEWITEAKREETRAARVAQAVEWMSEGKARHWKYQRAKAGAAA